MGDRHRQKNPKNRKTKVHLLFDEESRRDFLTGFHRRKLDRKKFHQHKLEERHKEELRQMRRERKKALEESVDLNIQFHDEVIEKDLSKEAEVHHDLPNHTVTVTSVTDIDLNPDGHHLGLNEVEYESNSDKEDEASVESEDDFGFSTNYKEEKHEEPPQNPPADPPFVKKKKSFLLKQRQRKRKKPSKLDKTKRKKVATSKKHINYTKKR